MGFKKGDIVICLTNGIGKYDIYNNKTYVVERDSWFDGIKNERVTLEGYTGSYYVPNFMLIEQYRILKINKIKNNIKKYEN